jgi:HD domain-containing protein
VIWHLPLPSPCNYHDPIMNRREFSKRLSAVGLTFSMPSLFSDAKTGAMAAYSEPSADLPREVAGIRLVDSKVAKEATQLLLESSPPYLFNHSVRTYLFGALLGKHAKSKWDEELLYLACMLHDLGLTERFADDLPFEIAGAEAARKFLEEREVSTERAGIVWDGIAMHPSAIALYKRPEIALVAAGAAADVVGSDISKIALATREQVLYTFPRLGFKKAFVRTCAEIARHHPRGAYRSFMRDIGEREVPGFFVPNICDAIAAAPFDD